VRHVLVESAAGGFALNLAPGMRAELRTPLQRLALAPDSGHAEVLLVLPPDSLLHIACGEMAFEIRAAGSVAVLPRPWLGAGWRDEAKYLLGVALVLLALVALAYLVPASCKRSNSGSSPSPSAAGSRWCRIRFSSRRGAERRRAEAVGAGRRPS
jgi:hypothetical protein